MGPQSARKQRARWRMRGVLAIAAAAALGGCATEGDFGRARPSVLPASLTNAFSLTGSPDVSGAPFTDDERQLRALARNILQPQFVSPGIFAFQSVGSGPPAVPQDRILYAQQLVDGPFRSTAGRYAKLIDDTRSDIGRIEPFFVVARRVADLDAKREQSIQFVSQTSDAELGATQARVRANLQVILDVYGTLKERVETYRFALERLVLAQPSPFAADAERARLDLERRLAEIEIFARPGATR
jgi:hypothetical protein